MSKTEWKDVKAENSSFVCRKCKSDNLKYRIPDNDGCYEDINYWCPDCNANWWVEGSDS